jgi:hypothetical protein
LNITSWQVTGEGNLICMCLSTSWRKKSGHVFTLKRSFPAFSLQVDVMDRLIFFSESSVRRLSGEVGGISRVRRLFFFGPASVCHFCRQVSGALRRFFT